MFTADTILLISGLTLTSTGLLLLFIVGRNRFNRRGVGGLQQYSNYMRGLLVTFLEKIAKLIGMLFLFCGVLLILLYLLGT